MTSSDPTPAIQIEEDQHQHQERGRNTNVHPVQSTADEINNKPQSRRSSISALVDRLRSRSRSNSRSRSRPRQLDGVEEDKEYVYSRRKSKDFQGEYGTILKAQVEYMERLREEQASQGITHNADGIPIPPPVNPPRESRRRSIIAALSRDNSRTRSRDPSRDRVGSRSSSRVRDGSLTVDENKEYRYSRRKSSDLSGPYGAILKAQLDYVEEIRSEQESHGVTHNADGIKYPDPVNPHVKNLHSHENDRIHRREEEHEQQTQASGLNKMLI